ncbi:Putative ring-cleaving dioxygenase mhqA [Listeria grandensis FSL F6-0971]|uniref:Putative ring-cleaving dioxygenase mhqA n=1 Tax=Listeria grandensis FSL F6-0971 TaxID=1265819 RepID=W7B3W9_9LIST|nr:ring-cleaving dioxygenase [Listeria grandensis]EUJ20622.1 Putative ring-cleaving dioxygenase mhqA [Listeria grandensis FSL F6-0971]
MELRGLHHISIITENARANFDFYTKVLGLRLVKKTVNQDDPYTYHLYYADEIGNPGTTVTFFEIPRANRGKKGYNSIARMGLRVPNDAALAYWEERLTMFHVKHEGVYEQFDRKVLDFEDVDGLAIQLMSDQRDKGVAGGKPWSESPVPVEFAILGLGPVLFSTLKKEKTDRVLTKVLGFDRVGAYEDDERLVTVFQVGEGGNGAEVQLEANFKDPHAVEGIGSVHHVAFRVADDAELQEWIQYIQDLGYPNSGFVDRHYFHSFYFREENGILIELATDGPGFQTDFEKEHGTYVELPPDLEGRRAEIEAHLTDLNSDV